MVLVYMNQFHNEGISILNDKVKDISSHFPFNFRNKLTSTLPASLIAAMMLSWSAKREWPTVENTTSTCFIAFTKLSWSYKSPCINLTIKYCSSKSFYIWKEKTNLCAYMEEGDTKTLESISMSLVWLFYFFSDGHSCIYLMLSSSSEKSRKTQSIQ